MALSWMCKQGGLSVLEKTRNDIEHYSSVVVLPAAVMSVQYKVKRQTKMEPDFVNAR